MANKIFPEGIKEQILARGVRDMPQNPASQGYTKDQIREFYYRPEEMIIDSMLQIEDHIVGEDGTDERVVSLEGKITGEKGLEGKVETLETDNVENKKDIDALEEKTKILNVDQTKPNRFLSEDGTYKEIKECECVPIVVDKEINENSTNMVENQAIAKAIKGKQDKLTAGENIKIENGVISAEGGSLPEGFNPDDYATKEDLNTKLDKATPNIGNTLIAKVYTQTTTGAPRLVEASGNPAAYSMVQRTQHGTVRGNTPIDYQDLTPKKYVDDAIANAGGGGKTAYMHVFWINNIASTFRVYLVSNSNEQLGLNAFKGYDTSQEVSFLISGWDYDNGVLNPQMVSELYYTERGDQAMKYAIYNNGETIEIAEDNLIREQII